jgi:PASTA domain
VFVLALGVLGALAFAAATLTARPTVVLPQLHGQTKNKIRRELRRLHLTAAFSSRYDDRGRPGTAVAQTPTAGAKVKQASTIDVALSKGPRPIDVPALTGQTEAAATAKLHHIRLQASVQSVPAPGTAPGVVTGQSPSAGHTLKPDQTVMLRVAETPSWHQVSSFSGQGGGRSVPVQIRGTQWRMVYSMSYDGTCNLVLFCNGPTAQVLGPGANTTFDLNDGSSQSKVFKAGPGVYQVQIQAGWDNARWSIQIEDWL